MGMAHLGKPLLLTGDLALHDSNGLLNAKSFKGDLLVILINNEGGGIFEHLPIANNKHFEDYSLHLNQSTSKHTVKLIC